MAEVSRVTAIWSAFPGAPGYSKFSFMPLTTDTARNAAGAAIAAFFDSIKSLLPNGLTVTVQPIVDDVDTITGELKATAGMTTTPAAVTSPTAAAPYAGGSGAIVTWLASGVFNGRRLQNRTYLVPLVGAFQNDGTPSSAAITTINSAASALVGLSTAELAVWNRSWTDDVPPVPNGALISPATTWTVRDMATQLRSRRT